MYLYMYLYNYISIYIYIYIYLYIYIYIYPPQNFQMIYEFKVLSRHTFLTKLNDCFFDLIGLFVGFNLIYWTSMGGSYFLLGSNLKKYGKFWKKAFFPGRYGRIGEIPRGRIWPD